VALALAVSLMFITLLLAAGTLALEREENAFSRLVRGLVSKTGLLVEKAALAAVCSVVVCLVMVAGLSLFVDIDWSRFPLWLAALAVAAVAFAALGLAIGGLTRDVRAASLLAFMLCLPLAFLALVPSGAVAPALYDVIRAVSAVFPFKPALDALDAGPERRRRPRRAAAPPRGARRGLRRARPALAATVRGHLDWLVHALPGHTPAAPAQDRGAA
jgi:ABC-2 type transport system permease protein